MNENIQINVLTFSWFFLTMGSSDGEELSQLYLELVDAYKKGLCLKMDKSPY